MSWDEGRAEALALLLLRLGLGYFLLVWGVNKFLAPAQTVAIWGYFYDISIDAQLPLLLGAGEVAVALAIMLGLWRRLSYAAGFLIHGVTVVVISSELLAPFTIENGYPVNRNNAVAVTVLAAFAALYLLRGRDRLSLDCWRATRAGRA